jgi:hypothetical protein
MKFKDKILESQFVNKNFHDDFKNLFGKFYYLTTLIFCSLALAFFIAKAAKNP